MYLNHESLVIVNFFFFFFLYRVSINYVSQIISCCLSKRRFSFTYLFIYFFFLITRGGMSYTFSTVVVPDDVSIAGVEVGS